MATHTSRQHKYRINLTRDEAPAHCTYPYVLRGYRAGGSYKRCLAATFELHTETFNAWTMVAGGIVSIAMFTWVALAIYPTDAAALVPFAALTSAVLLHMPFSVGFHLFRGIDLKAYTIWHRLDLAFIFIGCVLVTLALSWAVYDSCAGTMINTAAAAVVAAMCVQEVRGLQPHFTKEGLNRKQMIVFIGSIAIIAWFPMGYYAAREMLHGQRTIAATYAEAAVVCFQLGGWVFAAGFPEKYFPGVFDLVGSSHQLMHVAVIAAHVLKYLFVWELQQHRYKGSCYK